MLAGGAAVRFLQDSVGAASDLNEAVSLTQVTFRGAADSVLAMGETSAESLGLANDEALSFANSIGGLFIGFGDTRAEAAAMAEDVVQLGADLASAKNLSGGTAEALEILRSGLVGEVEPLRRIGVALNAAAVEQRALADTGKDSADALTEGEKAAARYALIFESLQAQGIVGDFARTQEGAANQTRIAAAEFRNARAELGQKLLPAYIELIHAVRDGMPLLAVVGDHLSQGAQGASLLASAIGPLIGLVTRLDEALEDLGGGAGVFGLTTALGQLTRITESAKQAWGSGIELGPITFGDDQHPEDVVQTAQEDIRVAMELLQLEFDDDSQLDLHEWLQPLSRFAAEFGLTVEQLLGELNIRGDLRDSILGALDEQGAAAGAAVGEVAQELEAAQEAATSGELGTLADDLARVAEEADEARQMLENLHGIEQSLDEATLNLQEANDALIGSVLENGRTFDVSTEAGRANLEAARASASAIRDQTIAYRANGASVDEANQSQNFYIESLRRQLLQSGLSRGETERLIDTYARVPRRVLTNLDADAGPARRETDAAVKYISENFAGKTFLATLGVAAGAAVSRTAETAAGLDKSAGGKGRPRGRPAISGLDLRSLLAPTEPVVNLTVSPTVNVSVQPRGLVFGSAEDVAKQLAVPIVERLSELGFWDHIIEEAAPVAVSAVDRATRSS